MFLHPHIFARYVTKVRSFEQVSFSPACKSPYIVPLYKIVNMSTAMVQASSRPSTPSVKARIPVAIPPSPGNWRHPKLDEIVRRQNAATFGDRNLRNVVWNASVLLAAFAFGPTLITK